ncbi:arginine--tRNA ligase [Govanella unica]|uniref:Arginine--tRNA ligase n=1 Tax=Govanella unica TaxID=2975056 RepID=A0A9X3TX93_9PROT|nr:arginine--tRNA ligase [Govania unica]MDA5193314.1 arginine--tRNA ligase [Govania unica]
MNIYAHFSSIIARHLAALVAAGELPAGLEGYGFTVEPPRDPSHGDLATNVAMVLAKPAGSNPRAIADKLAGLLRAEPDVTAVDVAGPGFINIRLRDDFIRARVPEILREGTDYGNSALGSGQKFNVEYVSANPTGPMHVGHCRGAVFGDALATLLVKAGYDVTREYYINDAGGQVDVLARSAFLRYREALGEDIGEIPQGFYPGDYLKDVGLALVAVFGRTIRAMDEAEWLPIVREFAIEAMMKMIRDDLLALGIKHDVFFSERSLHTDGRVQDALDALKAKGLIYTGVLEPPKGKTPEDWEPRPQTLFKATEFGDDVDRPVQKSDGSWTYFAGDMAYHYDKIQRGFSHMIDVFGADHGGYVKRMQAVVKALSGGEADLDVKIIQLVKLWKNGEPFKMSKRSGSFVTLRDVVDEVGKGVVRFIMLTRKNDAPLDFDFAKVTEQSRDNPVFYVQYAHARVMSVMRKAAEALPGVDLSDAALAGADLGRLIDGSEIALVKMLAYWPKLIESAAVAHEPHRVAFYLYDLASEFHGLWNKGNEDPSLRFLIDGDKDVTLARLALIRAVAVTVASGLAVLGVEPLDEMH